MRRDTETLVATAMAMAACAHGGSTRRVTAPLQETAAPCSSSAPVVSVAPTDPATPHQPEPDQPGARSAAPLPLPQSDPMPPPTPRCPSVGALVTTSAVAKREPPSRTRPPTSPAILDIELTVTLPTNPIQVTFAQNHLTVYGGLLVEQRLQTADRTNAVVLIPPSGTVARDGALLAFFRAATQ